MAISSINIYTSQVTDQVSQAVTATNVIFTYGVPVDGKCNSTGGDHKGIVGRNVSI